MGPRHLNFSGKATLKPTAVYDRLLLFAAVGLVAIGLLMVTSSSMVIAEKMYHTSFHYVIRQAIFLIVGLIAGLIVIRIDSSYWMRVSPWVLILSFILLILVLIPGLGHTVNGSRRWLGVSLFRLQVSELAKLASVMYLASYIVRHHEEVRHYASGFIKPMIIFTLMALLLLKEPDFGAAVVIITTALGMLFLAGVRFGQFFIMLSVASLSVLLLAVSQPYRLARLTAFLNPWANQFDSGYQLTQSLIAFGRGGLYGVGLGGSVQKLFYLPEAHTDFLFAVLAEELGLIGIGIVMGLFTLLIARAIVLARRAHRHNRLFAAFFAYGLTLWLALQVLVNIGVNIGVLPTKGLTLPLMSYGGSSMLINCIVIAMLLRIDYETRMMLFGHKT